MRRRRDWRIPPGMVCAAVVAALAGGSCVSPAGAAEESAVATAIVPFVERHCVQCHGPDDQEAGLDLSAFADETSILKGRASWQRVLEQVHAGSMPPEGEPRPDIAEAERFAKAVRDLFDRFDRTAAPDPGRVTMRRLSRVEYVNTVRDLVGVTIPLGDDFPADEIGYGFDNIGDFLRTSPALIDRYLAAAEAAMRAAIVVGKPFATTYFRIPIAKLRPDEKAIPLEEGQRVLTGREPLFTVFVPRAGWGGDYAIAFRMKGVEAGGEPPRFAILLDDEVVREGIVPENPVPVTGPDGKPKKDADWFECTMHLQAGREHRIGVSLVNPGADPSDPNTKRALLVGELRIPNAPPRPESHDALLAAPDGLEGIARSRHVLERFASRAYRRPATADDVERLMVVAKAAEASGEPWEGCMALAMQAALTSPKFLFRVEVDARPAADAHPIDDYDLASRLSYFLWSTMPDQQLLDLAAAGRLHQQIEPQVKRMLADPRSKALFDNFAAQWLNLRPLTGVTRDPAVFPEFSAELREDMAIETELFFDAVVREDRSIVDLIDGPFTFVNQRLAAIYEIADTNGNSSRAGVPPLRPKGDPIPAVPGKQEVLQTRDEWYVPESRFALNPFVRVNLENTGRGGLLTQASVLALNAHPARTSPVKRGKWVLEAILNAPPPPPPPNVPDLEKQEGTKDGRVLSLREKMELHRSNAACAGCHARMDAIGFAFEQFDAIGRFREQEDGVAIDPTGTLPGGETFRGPDGLKAILIRNKERFVRSMAEKMLMYAIGRGLEYYDTRVVDGIVAEVTTNDYRFSSLATAIARSDPFRLRRGSNQEDPKP